MKYVKRSFTFGHDVIWIGTDTEDFEVFHLRPLMLVELNRWVCLVTADYRRLPQSTADHRRIPQTNVHAHCRPKKIAGKRKIDDFHAN